VYKPNVEPSAAALIRHAADNPGVPWVAAAVGAVGIPYLALLALTVLEGRGGWSSFARKFLELGIDMCVLGIGVTGALFANDHIADHLGPSATATAISMLLIDLILAGFALHLRSAPESWNERRRATASIFLGVLILAINTGIVFWYG
jgi:hypothetical protein